MRSINEIVEAGFPERLAWAVVEQWGYAKDYEDVNGDFESDMKDVYSHGADTGWSGFSYYADTVAFFRRHRKAILALVEQASYEFDQSAFEFVRGFRCLQPVDRETDAQICRVLGGGRLRDGDLIVPNALAWYALEAVARAVCEE